MKKTVFLLSFIFIAFLIKAHPIKLSTSKLDFASNTLTINLFQDDFEAHLIKTYRQQLNFKTPDNITKKVLSDYIGKNFKISQNNKAISLQIQSISIIQENTVQITFKLSSLLATSKTLITNTILFDAFDTQSNVLHVVSKSATRTSFQFDKNKKTISLS
jgi:hypothetical protein